MTVRSPKSRRRRFDACELIRAWSAVKSDVPSSRCFAIPLHSTTPGSVNLLGAFLILLDSDTIRAKYVAGAKVPRKILVERLDRPLSREMEENLGLESI